VHTENQQNTAQHVPTIHCALAGVLKNTAGLPTTSAITHTTTPSSTPRRLVLGSKTLSGTDNTERFGSSDRKLGTPKNDLVALDSSTVVVLQ